MSVSLLLSALSLWQCAAGKPQPAPDAQAPAAKGEELLTDAVRTEVFPGAKITCLKNSCDLDCLIDVDPQQPRELLQVVCGGADQEKRRATAKRDPGSGLLMEGRPSATAWSATFFDDDTSCRLEVTLRGDKARARATGLARRFARQRTPEAPGPVCAQAVVLREGAQELAERELAAWDKKKGPTEVLYQPAAAFPKIVKGSDLQGAAADKVLLVGGFCPEKEGETIAKRLAVLFPEAKAVLVKGVAPTSCPRASGTVPVPIALSSGGLRLGSAIVTSADTGSKAPYGRWLVTLLDAQGSLVDWKNIEIPRELPGAGEDKPYDHGACDVGVERMGSALRLERRCRVNVVPWSCIEKASELLTVTVKVAGKALSQSSETAIEKPTKCTPR